MRLDFAHTFILFIICTSLLLCSSVCLTDSPSDASQLNALQRQFPELARQTVAGDGYGGDGFTVLPVLRNEQPATVIMLHGLGGTGEEWGYASLALSFFSLNFVKFIIPTALTQPVTYLNRSLPSWFDIYSPLDLTYSINSAQMFQSMARVNRIIQGEISSGVIARRIFLVGFSQGGALALTTFLRSPFGLAGCVGVATWLPLENQYPDKLSNQIQDTELLLMHVRYLISSVMIFFANAVVFSTFEMKSSNLFVWYFLPQCAAFGYHRHIHKPNYMHQQGTEDVVVPIPYAWRSAQSINKFGESANLTANLTRLVGDGHLLVNDLVMNGLEEYVSQRAEGTTRFLISLVSNLTKSFASINSDVSNKLSLQLWLYPSHCPIFFLTLIIIGE